MLTVENLKERQRIGEVIRQARKNKKITQTQLGAEIGIGKVAVANYESGKIKVIPFEKRVKLAEILNVPLSDLLYSDEIMEKVREELGINYLNKEYDLLDALMIELQTDLENADSAEKIEAVKAKFEAFEKKRLKLEKGVASLQSLLEEVKLKVSESKKQDNSI